MLVFYGWYFLGLGVCFLILFVGDLGAANACYITLGYALPASLYSPKLEQRAYSKRYRFSTLLFLYSLHRKVGFLARFLPLRYRGLVERNLLGLILSLVVYLVTGEGQVWLWGLGFALFEALWFWRLNRLYLLLEAPSSEPDIK